MDHRELLKGNTRIKIFLGEFGSGKTEIAINYAIQLKNEGINVAIVDFDLVKPYFRTRENRAILEEKNILLVAPDPRLINSDLPVMPQNLTNILYDTNYHVIMDVGGGESAIALGQIYHQLAENSYEALMVVNTCRPFTATAAGIIDALHRIERVSRLKITGMVSNTNLAQETTIQNVLEGLKIVQDAACQLGLPLKWAVAPEWLKDKVNTRYPILILRPYTQYPWML